MSIENSQIVDTKIMITVEVANGIGPRTATDPSAVDAGALDEVAVGAAGVPAEGLPDEAADHLVGVRLGDPPLDDPGVRPAYDHADRTDDADADHHRHPRDHGADGDVAVLEARQDHVVDHPSDGEAGGDRADGEHARRRRRR